ncbi:MAG TPA: MscL family protein [Thermoplasmata archaeon]|nr:MscL family protein [Thermoplasmata archaeon]
MSIVEDFKKFLISGSLVTMAVAFVVGLAIVALIGALVTDIIDPLISSAGHIDFAHLGILTVNGSPLLGGALLGAIVNFVVLMLVVFFLIVLPYEKYQDRKKARAAAAPPTTRECPSCCNTIPIKASRCGFCTSTVPPVSA